MKDPATMTNAQLRDTLKRTDAQQDYLLQDLIRDGRGNLTFGDMRANPDAHPAIRPLLQLNVQRAAIRHEAEARYGPEGTRCLDQRGGARIKT